MPGIPSQCWVHPPVPAPRLDAAVSPLQCWGRRNALFLGFVVVLFTMPCSAIAKSPCLCSLPLHWVLPIPNPLHLNHPRAGPWPSLIFPLQVFPVGQESGSQLHPNPLVHQLGLPSYPMKCLTLGAALPGLAAFPQRDIWSIPVMFSHLEAKS